MIEKGQHFTPDPAPDGTIPPPIIRFSFDPSDSDSVTGSITPQQVKDRRGQQDSHKALLPAAPVLSDVTSQQQRGSMQELELLDLDTPQHPILDDIDVTLRRKVSSCGQEGGMACRLQDDASCDTLGRVLFQI